jgi:antibiotic biosynthesis monooxygenase (ABM) superfamily enzyme
MQQDTCLEVVIYRVKADHHNRYQPIRQQMEAEMAALPGFLGIKTLPSTATENQYIDMVSWKNRDLAKLGYETWKNLPSAKALMECIETVCFTDHFINKG